MLYAILCYGEEAKVRSIGKQRDEQLMAELAVVDEELVKEGKLGPHFRLQGIGSARTVRASSAQVLDGPFAETKEQLLGLYVVDCESMDEALETARRLEVPRKRANVATALEVRPLMSYYPGVSVE